MKRLLPYKGCIAKVCYFKIFIICIERQAKEDKKAKVIQKVYREKMKKRKEIREQEASVAVIQKKYRQKLEKRKRRKEENEKATVIQQMYRAKNKKKKLMMQKGTLLVYSYLSFLEENKKATVIQRIYRDKKAKQKEEAIRIQENEKVTMI